MRLICPYCDAVTNSDDVTANCSVCGASIDIDDEAVE